MIRLNPYNFHLSDWDNYKYYLYIICPDDSIAKQIQILKMPTDKYNLLTEKLTKEREKNKIENASNRRQI